MLVLSSSKLAIIIATTTMMASSFSSFTAVAFAFAPPVAQRLASASFMSSFMKATVDDMIGDNVDAHVVTTNTNIQNRRELIKSLPGRAAALSAIVGGGIASSGLIVDTILPRSATAATTAAAEAAAANDKKAQQPIYPPGAETGYGPLQDLSKITKNTNKQTNKHDRMFYINFPFVSSSSSSSLTFLLLHLHSHFII